jgi:drug/metabolite transporter (DMT)-like permease
MNKKFTKLIGYISLVAVTIFWGSSFVSSKLVLTILPPMTLAFLRYFFSFLTLFIFFLIFEKDKWLKKEDYLNLALSSGIGIFIYFIGEYNALNYISASTASIIVSLLPIFMLITNFFLFSEKITVTKIIVIILTLVGVYLVVQADFIVMFEESLIGYSLMLMGVAAWVVYSISTVKMRAKNSNLKVITYQAGLALVLFFPLALNNFSTIFDLNFIHWINVLYLGVFASGLAFYLYVYSLKALGTLPAAIFGNLVPLVTIVSGYIFLNETLTPIQISGGLLIIITLIGYTWINGKNGAVNKND